MKRLLLIFAALPLMASCAADKPEPVVRTVTVDVPVPVPCKPDLGPEPVYPDTAAALAAVPHPEAIKGLAAAVMDPSMLVLEMENINYQAGLLLKGRLMRIQRDTEKTAALTGCAH